MGKTDIVTKNYMRGSDIFADAFNFLIYNGEARIQSQSLQERDATELAVLFSNDSVKNETEVQQKYRDVLKRAVIMQNKEATYLLLGIENQTDIHYAMPVRNMIYDSLQYGKTGNGNRSRAQEKERQEWDTGRISVGILQG